MVACVRKFGKCLGRVRCPCLVSFCRKIRNLFSDLFIILRKNLRIRRRRYIALILEMLTPIVIVALLVLAGANSYKSLLRVENLAFSFENDVDMNDTLEGFYDLGSHFQEEHLLQHLVCNGPYEKLNQVHKRPDRHCYIGYVAESETENAIFTSPDFLKHFGSHTKFIKFDNEEEIDKCLKDVEYEDAAGKQKCSNELRPKSTEPTAEDEILWFRGAVVFQTSVRDLDVRYKIRLMESHYGYLRHVLKTSTLYPSIYDRREYSVSYLESGFLALQLLIDRMIIIHIRDVINDNILNQEIVFGATTTCTCAVAMYEIPHRQSDQFHDPQDPLELTDDYEIIEDDEEMEEEDHDHDSGYLQHRLSAVQRSNQVNKQALIVSTMLVLSFTFLIASEQRRIASEKENGLTILLLVTGMTHRMQWIGNLLAITLSYTPTITVVVILLTVKFNKSEGAVFEFASGSILWLLFFLYVMALASACYFTTVFFDRPMTAITASVSFWVTSFLAPVYHVDYYYDIVPIWVTLIACLHPSIALQMAFRLLIRFEKHKVFTTVLAMTRFIPTDPLRIIFIVIIFIVETIIYMVLAIYLDRILKSKYGVNKPWYYIFKPSEYYSSSNAQVAPSEMTGQSTPDQPGFEHCHEDAEPTVITTNLTKKYGKTVAVDNLNFQLNQGEIFALLGHNGAGKSTTLNLFSGFTSATSGTAKICGYDITTHMVQIQSFTGMCPQYSWLYDDLTPYEHLVIFGRLRGLRGDDATEESIELMEKLRIIEMSNWAVRKLSRGDRRKLSLAIALIGNPKIILLDEPTAGLDYYSRRAVWDLLLKIRSNHTIIFSTHFMDEAELLGDRIGILANGKMHVCGSHAFLRRHFGLGYSLKIETDPHRKPNPGEVLEIVQGSIPNATLSTLPISPNAHRVCTCNLPTEGYSTSSMSTLFTDLEQKKEELGIIGFSVSYATVDEVFLQLTRQLNPTAEEAIPIENDDHNYNEQGREENIKRMFTPKRKLLRSFIQFYLLFKKRMLFTWRNKRIFLFQFIIPFCIYLVGIVRLGSHVESHGRDGPPLELTLDVYKDAITLFHASRETYIQSNVLKEVIGKSATLSKSSDLSGDYIHEEYTSLRNNHFAGISAETGNKGEMYVHFSPYVVHSAPLALNLFSNALVKHMDINKRIVTTNHPLQHPYFKNANFEEDPYAPDVYSMMSTLSSTITVAFCVIFPLEERLSGVKHLQLMSGVNAGIYWLAIFTWDFLLIMCEGGMLLMFSFFYEPLRVFAVDGEKDGTAIGLAGITISYLYCGLMMAYTVSQYAHSKSGGFALLMSITLLFGVILPFFTFGVGSPEVNIDNFALWLFQTIPPYALASAQRKYAVTILGNGRCNHFTDLGVEKYCHANEVKKEHDVRKVTCCRNCALIPISDDCYDRSEFTRPPWTVVHHSFAEEQAKLGVHDHSLARTDTRNIFYELVFLIVIGLILNILVVFVDSDALAFLSSCISGERGRAFQTNVEDGDVLDEMDHVERMVDTKQTNKEALVVHNMCKSYGTYPALHNVSFTVHPGESFGIIGVNGAGKSTLFKLLTGVIPQTYGNIYSVDCSLTKKRSHLMEKMGYIPQHGLALFDYLTATETVVFFGRLRGLSYKDAKESGESLLKKMGLTESGDIRVSVLSGGTKRRLGTVVAIIAEPPILVFDEPTSAADPASRRAYWEIIKEVKKGGHTVIISSHRIHECEDLCHRMTILVDGKFQCIGSPTHLKEKFGNGFKLMVKLVPGPAESQEYVSSLSEAIVKTFNPCTLRDRRRNVIQYVIHNANASWDYLFQMMAHIKLRYNDLVEDYAFSNTTLEEVFLSFVVLQNCGRILDQSAGCCALKNV